MALSIQETLAGKGISPSAEHLGRLESKWQEVLDLKGDLDNVNLEDADIALHNTPGGDHVE
ncbi:hypothetical protein OIU93_18115 [Paeniglutamicibacter sp. ZC-3]|uniref:hypothetical protein n=1 Tax=Paeniglutamicibacter sp. ZC-3 TaxID=2986919 RepID=UPI0021F73C5E|nr:hypothetical protein [Paeniglutamicibacter sp. ZC-3]MCV9996195.1 hypothetical protein [Paeniglutamicibacter sp. ZC-3]